MNAPTLPALTALRFFAALLVVLHHYSPAKSFLPPALTSLGMSAVSFFFVLSGFILTYHYTAPASGLIVARRTFFVARLARLMPSYLLALAVVTPLHSTKFVAGFMLVPLLAQAWVPPAALLWNPPAWSLSVEWFFYLLFPFLVRSFQGRNATTVLLVSAGCTAAIPMLQDVLLSLGAVQTGSNAQLPQNWIHFFAYFPICRLPEFTAGMALAKIFTSARPIEARVFSKLAMAATAAMVVCAALRLDYPIAGSGFVVLIISAALIFGVAGANGAFVRRLATPSLTALGEASYALYILHYPVLLWWLSSPHRNRLAQWSAEADFLSYLALAVGLALLVHRYYERPLRAYLVTTLTYPRSDSGGLTSANQAPASRTT